MLETVGAHVIDNHSKEEQLYEDLLRIVSYRILLEYKMVLKVKTTLITNSKMSG